MPVATRLRTVPPDQGPVSMADDPLADGFREWVFAGRPGSAGTAETDRSTRSGEVPRSKYEAVANAAENPPPPTRPALISHFNGRNLDWAIAVPYRPICFDFPASNPFSVSRNRPDTAA